jgi:hypothetical protein
MAKTIRPAYPAEFSIGLLLLIFGLSMFLSHQIFEISNRELNQGKNIYIGMFLVSTAVVIMFLVLWEEFLFPVKVKPAEDGGLVFRNHRKKLKKQILIYCIIPVLFIVVYLEYEVRLFSFFIWAAICIVFPVVGKLVSGIKNYNDFLKIMDHGIEYRNNEKSGTYKVTDIQQIILFKDERKVLHKIQLLLTNGNQVPIDIDEMELDAFCVTIDGYMTTHYGTLVKEASSV